MIAMTPKISSLAQVEAQNPRPPRRIRQTHPLNQIRLVAVEKAAAELIQAVEEALPAKVAAVGLLMEEVMAAAVKAEEKAVRAAAKAEKVAAVATEVVTEAKAEAKAVKVAAAMAAARAEAEETVEQGAAALKVMGTVMKVEDDRHRAKERLVSKLIRGTDDEEADDWPEGAGDADEEE
jgi:hypothetical protein